MAWQTMSKYNLPPDVDAWLLRVAESSCVPTPWQEALARLSDASTAQERLAVYQAVRNSGWLSENANFYLLAAHIEEMADVEAAMKLRDLDERIDALERAHGNPEGEPWTDDRAAEEYDELSAQFQEAWNEIFIGILTASGEREIADLYATGPDKYARRYASGRESFRTEIPIHNAGSPDDLVPIASFVNVAHAELARNVLESEEIRASLSNVNLVLWDWQCSNATGGVTVHVRRADAPRAGSLLAAKHPGPEENRPPWICCSCGQRVAGGWQVCWQCGRSMDTPPDELPAEQPAAPMPTEGNVAAEMQVIRILGAAAIVLLVLLPLAGGAVVLAAVNALFVALVVVLMIWFASAADSPVAAQAATDSSDAPLPRTRQTRSRVSSAIVQRAWRAAMFGIFAFPPLGVYALWLLWKLAGRNTPLGAADRWRIGLAFVFGLVGVLYCFLFVAGVLTFTLSTRGRPY